MDDRRRAVEASDVADSVDVDVPSARGLARAVIRPVMRGWLRLQVEDEHHVPADGPVLIASTHCSHADSMALGAGLRRPVFFLGDERLANWPVLGRWLPRMGMVRVKRGQGDTDALAAVRHLLEEGHAVVVYPEGSRSRDGRVHLLRSGVSRVAAAAQVPVVPAAVAGSYDVWPTNARPRLTGGKVTIRFGPAMDPPRQQPASRRHFNHALQRALADLAGVEMDDTFAPVGGVETPPDVADTEATPRDDATRDGVDSGDGPRDGA